jgi:uncharacterized protein (DUF1697 family)
MAELKALVEGLGHANARTYVNSGNVVFETERNDPDVIAEGMVQALKKHIGLPVPVVVRTAEELVEIVEKNPFPDAVKEPKTLHVSFLEVEPASALVDKLQEVERGADDFRVIGKQVYLFYPNFTSGAVFMPTGLDKALKVTATSRNWRTVTTLLEMCGAS